MEQGNNSLATPGNWGLLRQFNGDGDDDDDDDDVGDDDDGNDNGDAWKFLSRNTYDKKIWRHGPLPYSEASQKQPYHKKSYKNHVIILSSLSSHSH